MQIKITARHLALTKAISDYVRKKVEKAEHYFDHVIRAQVILSVEKKYRQDAEIIINTGMGKIFRGKSESQDLYAALDLAMDKIEKQLTKIKEKSKIHKKGNASVSAFKKRGLRTPGSRRTDKIMEVKRFDIKPETLQEAINEMEVFGYKFYMFMNAENSQINVLYKKGNGSLGLLEPEF